MNAPIRIEDATGVCGVRDDTRLLAEMAHTARGAASAPGRGLDLGTGSGYVGVYLAQRGWQVDAVDVSPRALALAARNAARNNVQLRLYESNLFSAVQGPYDVIAFNPPMRADETEGSRTLTSTLRRVGFLANLLMRLTQPVLERKRLPFLAEIARDARPHLAAGGCLLLVISPLEAQELPRMTPGLRLTASRPIGTIPGLCVVAFAFDDERVRHA